MKKLEEAGNKNLVLDVTGKTAKETGQCRHRPPDRFEGRRPLLRLPSIVNLNRFAKGDSRLQTAYAAMFTEKYGSIIVMENMTYARHCPCTACVRTSSPIPRSP